MKARLTRERALELLANHKFKLRRMTYGTMEGDTLCGCAVALRALDITEDIETVKRAVENGRLVAAYGHVFVSTAIADQLKDDAEYFDGLDDGFEVAGKLPEAWIRNRTPTWEMGVEDGRMIREIYLEREQDV